MCIPGTIMAAAGCSSVRNRKFKIQNEASLPDTLGHTFRFGRSLRSARMFGNEPRASAAGRLRPANRCAIDSMRKSPAAERMGLRHKGTSPPPEDGCGLPIAPRSIPLQLLSANQPQTTSGPL